MQLQIQIPIQITVSVPENKKIPIQELTSAIKIEATILKVLEEIDRLLISSMQKEYKNEYHRHQREERTVVTQLGKTTFSFTRLRKSQQEKPFVLSITLI